MPKDIGTRLRQAIQEEEARASKRLQSLDESARLAEQKFEPVKQAAVDLQHELAAVPGIEVTVNPDSVWVTLADRELRFSYNSGSQRFIGEEAVHSWYDGEAYSDLYEWDRAEACIESLIRLCAKYVRMARAISRPPAAE